MSEIEKVQLKLKLMLSEKLLASFPATFCNHLSTDASFLTRESTHKLADVLWSFMCTSEHLMCMSVTKQATHLRLKRSKRWNSDLSACMSRVSTFRS